MQGQGEKLTKDGIMIKGNFESGKLIGPCILETKEGAIFNG